MSLINEKFYHIDEPNGIFKVVKNSTNLDYYYAVYFHPTFGSCKVLRDSDIGKSFFLSRSEMLDARVKRAERILQCEKDCRDRKI